MATISGPSHEEGLWDGRPGRRLADDPARTDDKSELTVGGQAGAGVAGPFWRPFWRPEEPAELVWRGGGRCRSKSNPAVCSGARNTIGTRIRQIISTPGPHGSIALHMLRKEACRHDS
jgi:hypothetical protein